ncbi:hypothetical protein A0X89_01825 [Campylobacter coli]|nr:hypothetical protein [Campylobacter coli]
MCKNIILIDSKLEWIETILKLENINISLLITPKFKEAQEKFGCKIAKIFPRELKNTEFNTFYFSEYNINYDEIEKYRSTQLKVEHYLNRNLSDDGLRQYFYFRALSYWLDYFSKNKIDMVFLNTVEHGFHNDSPVIDIAKNLNIPVYIVSYSTGVTINEKDIEIKTLIKYNSNSFVNLLAIKNFSGEENEVNIENYLKLLAKAHHKNKNLKLTFKNPIKYFIDTRLKTFLAFIAKFFYTPKQEYNKEGKKNNYLHMTKYEIFKNSIYINRIRNLYNKISNKVDLREKYIYYPLHLEPEASIMVRGTMTSQLFSLKLIDDVLERIGKGEYKIFVKEHPHQFFIYEKDLFYLKNIHHYRSNFFYAQIKSMKNVVLVDINTPSTDLLKNSQAVVSISGSSLIEAVAYKKPLITFGNSLSFVELLKDAFVVKSRKDLELALDKIINDFTPKYDDLNQIIKNYTFFKKTSIDENRDFYSKLFSLLVNKE